MVGELGERVVPGLGVVWGAWRLSPGARIQRAGVRGTHWRARKCPCGTGWRGWRGSPRAAARDLAWEAPAEGV